MKIFLQKIGFESFWSLKENSTLIYEMWLLLINWYNLQYHDLLFLKYKKIDNRSWDIYVLSNTETCLFYIFWIIRNNSVV